MFPPLDVAGGGPAWLAASLPPAGCVPGRDCSRADSRRGLVPWLDDQAGGSLVAAAGPCLSECQRVLVDTPGVGAPDLGVRAGVGVIVAVKGDLVSADDVGPLRCPPGRGRWSSGLPEAPV